MSNEDLPFIPLAIPTVGETEAANLQKCIADNFVSTAGEFVVEFEKRVAELSGTTHAAAMGAGTMGLHMALHCSGVKPGELVILPSFTFIASANSIAHCHAMPWFFDVEASSWTLDPKQVEHGLRTQTERRSDGVYHKPTGRRVAAIMPVYTLGTPADMDTLGALAKEFDLPLIADAAAAIGVSYMGKSIGEIADLTCYSFNGNKTITSGGGGMVVGNDEAVMKRIKHVSTTARVSTDYEHDEVGWNYRMTNVEAAIGVAQMDRLPDFLEAKTRIRRAYDEAFAELDMVTPFPNPSNRGSTYWFSGFCLKDNAKMSAGEICKALGEARIQARTFWQPVHTQAPFKNAPCEALPVTEDMWSRIVTLPCSTSLTEADQYRVIEAVKSLLSN